MINEYHSSYLEFDMAFESLRAALLLRKSTVKFPSIVMLLSGYVSYRGSCNFGFCIKAGSTAKKK